MSGALRVVERNLAHPSLARALPRRHSGLARLRAPFTLRTSLGRASGPGSRRRNTAGRIRAARLPRTADERSSHGALRIGLPFGPAYALRPPSRRARSPFGACMRSLRSQAWRSARCRRVPPRYARPRRVRLRLTPSPRSRRRAKPPAPFCLPFARGGVTSQQPSCRSDRLAPAMSPAARLRHSMARGARFGGEQGRSPARPRNSQASGGTGCALRLPAVAALRSAGLTPGLAVAGVRFQRLAGVARSFFVVLDVRGKCSRPLFRILFERCIELIHYFFRCRRCLHTLTRRSFLFHRAELVTRTPGNKVLLAAASHLQTPRLVFSSSADA